MADTLDALVLVAFDDIPGVGSELAPWEDRRPLDGRVDLAGAFAPVRHDGTVGVTATGIGKSAAATAVTRLLTAEGLDLADTFFLSVGVAGGPPDTVSVGTVAIADAIVDWDAKLRFDDGRIEPNPYLLERVVLRLDDDLVAAAMAIAEDLAPGGSDPDLIRGTNLCGDELWHGERLATQAASLAARLDADGYVATEMEDYGTALALDRFGRLDRYLSVRGIANFDRPVDGEVDLEGALARGFPRAIENAVRVADAIVDGLTHDGDRHG